MGLRGLGGPKPDPNNKFFRKFGTRCRTLQRSPGPFSWIRGRKVGKGGDGTGRGANARERKKGGRGGSAHQLQLLDPPENLSCAQFRNSGEEGLPHEALMSLCELFQPLHVRVR